MESNWFDELSKQWAMSMSRRAALRGVGGGGIAATLLVVAGVRPNSIAAQAGRSLGTAGSPAASHAIERIVIDFEDMTTGGDGTGDVVAVGNRYASKGVTFDSIAIDYSKGIAIPGFAHSGTKAIETCYGIEFCAKPIAMNFTAPVMRVKLWVGVSAWLDAPYTVALRALDASGAEVGRATATLGPSPRAIPIQTPLEVAASSANIVRAEVSYLPLGPDQPYTNHLAADDVEFDVPQVAKHRRCGWIGSDSTTPQGIQSFHDNAAWFDAIHPKWYVLNAADSVSIDSLPGYADDPTIIATARTNGVQLIPMVDGGTSLVRSRP